MTTLAARCTVIGGMTTKCYETHITDWADTGFARRFLWVHYRLNHSAAKLEDAIKQWKRYRIDHDFSVRVPADRVIPAATIPATMHARFDAVLKYQRSRITPRVVLQRIYAVLMWKFARQPKRAHDILLDFLPALTADGAVLEV